MNSSRKFKRTIENFTCLNCNFEIQGNGYTNHCPKCLWSCHVDINPGDRENPCQGPMQAINVIEQAGTYRIIHKCLKCGTVKRVKSSATDDFETMLKICRSKSLPE